MKIKFIKSGVGVGLAYFEGNTLDCNASLGNELIELGYAVGITTAPESLPADMPGRKLLIENGFETIQEVKPLTIDQLTEIKGIGKKLAENIIKFIEQ
jgi:NAD-dependent DNA ligase